jgi:hypothetical protein
MVEDISITMMDGEKEGRKTKLSSRKRFISYDHSGLMLRGTAEGASEA